MEYLAAVLFWLPLLFGLYLPLAFTHFSQAPADRLSTVRVALVVAVVGTIPVAVELRTAGTWSPGWYDAGVFLTSVFLGLFAVVVGLIGVVLYAVLDPHSRPSVPDHPG